ncbi:MAG: GNAT family N-acetyltransferase [Myxococcota bacterium]
MHLETERLRLRPYELADAGPTHYWQRDPEVMRHLGGVKNDELASYEGFLREVVAKYAAHAAAGFPWNAFVVFEKASWRPVGTGILKPLPAPGEGDLDEIEVGWHLARQVWGRGYATEMGRALLDHAFAKTDRELINAVVAPENAASAAVCARLGFTRAEPLPCRYGDVLRFVMTREAWARRESARQAPPR